MKPTYEEYCKATTYAKIRYRFGTYIQLIALILLIVLIIYTVTNIEEMKANPKDYAEEKLGVVCYIPSFQNYDGDFRNFTNIEEG